MVRYPAEDPLHALFVMALSTGMRSGELFGLQWGDLDFNKGFVMVQRTLEELSGKLRVKPPKTAAGRRRIDLPANVLTILETHRKSQLASGHIKHPVFCDAQGGWLRRPTVARRHFHPLIKSAGVPKIRFHDLRHTAATLMLIEGVHIKAVAQRLGHNDERITLQIYSHLLPSVQRDAADRLDHYFG